jgi:hypothetical protein
LPPKEEDDSSPTAAKHYLIEAVATKNKDFQGYEVLMETAIDILRDSDPYH